MLLEKISEELKEKSKVVPLTSENLTPRESALLEKIKAETKGLNVNNITRTRAYLDFYLEYPEIHWSLLAHMVSRNGGYNMTDLKGEFLPRLLTKKERESFFHFLERANWLIFQDAYPQLLLYRESVKRKKPFFYLLSFLNISTFMETIWNSFWESGEKGILTLGLIVNEQNYLETRVVQNPHYQKEVLGKFEFFLQDLLSFNHVLFPYRKRNLAGQTVHQFESLQERILIGKRLYKVLFKEKDRWKQIVEWADSHPHTGSRKDYWPHIFNNINEGLPGFAYQLRLKSCQLRKGSSKLYSPNLEIAWKNVSHEEAEIGEWFNDWRVVNFLVEDEEIIDGEIKHEYCKTLEQLELAALAKKVIHFLE